MSRCVVTEFIELELVKLTNLYSRLSVVFVLTTMRLQSFNLIDIYLFRIISPTEVRTVPEAMSRIPNISIQFLCPGKISFKIVYWPRTMNRIIVVLRIMVKVFAGNLDRATVYSTV